MTCAPSFCRAQRRTPVVRGCGNNSGLRRSSPKRRAQNDCTRRLSVNCERGGPHQRHVIGTISDDPQCWLLRKRRDNLDCRAADQSGLSSGKTRRRFSGRLSGRKPRIETRAVTASRVRFRIRPAPLRPGAASGHPTPLCFWAASSRQNTGVPATVQVPFGRGKEMNSIGAAPDTAYRPVGRLG